MTPMRLGTQASRKWSFRGAYARRPALLSFSFSISLCRSFFRSFVACNIRACLAASKSPFPPSILYRFPFPFARLIGVDRTAVSRAIGVDPSRPFLEYPLLSTRSVYIFNRFDTLSFRRTNRFNSDFNSIEFTALPSERWSCFIYFFFSFSVAAVFIWAGNDVEVK